MASRAPETLSHCPLPFQWRGLEIRALTLQLRRVTRPRSPEELEALAASSPLPSLPPAPPLQRAEPSCNLSPEAKENVKGHQDSSCRAQTHYQLGLRMGKKKKRKSPAWCTTSQLWASPRLEAVDIVHNQDSKPSLDEDIVCILWLWDDTEVDLGKINK